MRQQGWYTQTDQLHPGECPPKQRTIVSDKQKCCYAQHMEESDVRLQNTQYTELLYYTKLTRIYTHSNIW